MLGGERGQKVALLAGETAWQSRPDAMAIKNQGFEEQPPAPLSGQPLPVPAAPGPSLDAIASAIVSADVTEKDWMYFDRSLNEIRFSRSDQIHKPIFGDW
jgi:hypothetical protein